jgi:hypothetical protein
MPPMSPVSYPYKEYQLFFDDEYRNAEVESLGELYQVIWEKYIAERRIGVTFVLVRHGTDQKTFWKGVEMWRANQRQEEEEETSDV